MHLLWLPYRLLRIFTFALSSASCPETGFIRDSRFQPKFPHHTNTPCYGALRDLFSFAVLSGNAAWLCTFEARERRKEGEWDEWEGGGRTKKRGPTFPLLPFVPFSLFSPFSKLIACRLQNYCLIVTINCWHSGKRTRCQEVQCAAKTISLLTILPIPDQMPKGCAILHTFLL
jgi:hypothetical protein